VIYGSPDGYFESGTKLDFGWPSSTPIVVWNRKGNRMAFKPNYRQQRAERDRNARSKQAEKLQKLQEKSQRRKAERGKSDVLAQGKQDGSES
jgi:hypothetical protein